MVLNAPGHHRALLVACALGAACRPSEGARLNVLFLVSGARADHASICGAERPTTPFLERLVYDHRATVSCATYAASADPVGALASVWLDAAVPEHGLHSAPGPAEGPVTTLARRYADAGWQTALVAGSPLWSQHPSLLDGLDHVDAPPHKRSAVEVVAALKALPMDDARDTFLTVHLDDAVDPWPALDGSAGFGGQRAALDLDAAIEGGVLRQAWDHATLSLDQTTRLLASATDHYDAGLHAADAGVRGALAVLEQRRGALAGARVLVTGDAGYYLGEHDLIGRVDALWQPGVRVPLLLVHLRDKRPPPLPSAPLSNRFTTSLLRRGIVPRPTPVPVAHGVAPAEPGDPGDDQVAVWPEAGVKLLTQRGHPSRVAPDDDPLERKLRMPYNHEAYPTLEAELARWSAWLLRRDAEAP